MLDHHIQRTIIHTLAFAPKLTFTELKPDTLDNKLFTYHLKKTIQEGYVHKTEDGHYELTPHGRKLSTGVMDKSSELIVERPLSALFLVIRRKADGAWLLYRRKTHPMINYQGFMHTRPSAEYDVSENAKVHCQLKTGLSGEFTPLGGGYVRTLLHDGTLESYTHFTLLYCDDIQGELAPTDTHAEYFWETDPDFTAPDMFPTTQFLKDAYDAKQPFFIEKSFTV